MTDEKKMQYSPVLDDGVPSDVTIQSNDGGELFVHKVVLNGHSKFFRAIEYDRDDHSLKLDRKFTELEALFAFLYNAGRAVFLTWENVFLAFGPAIQYDVPIVVDACSQFILTELPENNFLVAGRTTTHLAQNYQRIYSFLKKHSSFPRRSEIWRVWKDKLIDAAEVHPVHLNPYMPVRMGEFTRFSPHDFGGVMYYMNLIPLSTV